MVKNEITAQNVRAAFAGEGQAYQRYLVWGRRAEKEGFAGVGLLFKAVAYAEEVHAGNHFVVHNNLEGDFLVGSSGGFGIAVTAENLEGAIAGENFEAEQMYPAFILVSRDQGEKDAERSFYYALEAEKIHAGLFSEARQAVENGDDYPVQSVSVCPVCGHTVKDGVPDKCPTCGAPGAKFKIFNKE